MYHTADMILRLYMAISDANLQFKYFQMKSRDRRQYINEKWSYQIYFEEEKKRSYYNDMIRKVKNKIPSIDFKNHKRFNMGIDHNGSYLGNFLQPMMVKFFSQHEDLITFLLLWRPKFNCCSIEILNDTSALLKP